MQLAEEFGIGCFGIFEIAYWAFAKEEAEHRTDAVARNGNLCCFGCFENAFD